MEIRHVPLPGLEVERQVCACFLDVERDLLAKRGDLGHDIYADAELFLQLLDILALLADYLGYRLVLHLDRDLPVVQYLHGRGAIELPYLLENLLLGELLEGRRLLAS